MTVNGTDSEPESIVILGIAFVLWQQDVVGDIFSQAALSLAARLHISLHFMQSAIPIATQSFYAKTAKSLADSQGKRGVFLPNGQHPSVWHH